MNLTPTELQFLLTALDRYPATTAQQLELKAELTLKLLRTANGIVNDSPK